MPYKLEDNCVKKADTGETVPGGCHDNHDDAVKHLRALEANVADSSVVEMSMRISKASYNKSEDSPMNWTAVSSDTESDLYKESMSAELYDDFCNRIQNNTPVPEQFKSVICEHDWCGGMPYLSIAHYKAGEALVNVPGAVHTVFVDGKFLKAKGKLHDNGLGRAVWNSLLDDMYRKRSGDNEHQPVRISIGFLDLEHKHLAQSGGQEFTFTRTDIGQICPLCAQGIGGKIYTKGQLVHLAMTRVPVNPRTIMVAEKSMNDEIQTKRDDAKSIVGDLVDALEEKSIANDVLVVRSEDGSAPKEEADMLEPCYDPNTDSYNQECIDGIMDKYMPGLMSKIGTAVKSLIRDEVVANAKRKDVTPADKKQAEKEYGDVKYADETNKKYPIDTKEHAQAALSYWGMPKNREKYSPEDQKKIGARIRSAAKKFGIQVTDNKSLVEEAMEENVEKMQAAGTNVPEKPFSHTQDGVTITGDGNNSMPNPVKAKAEDDESSEEDTKGDEKEMKSLDTSYNALKSVLATGDVAKIQEAFNALGSEVEKAFTPEQPKAEVDIATIVKSAIQDALAPLKVEIATLKAAQGSAPTASVAKSKALSINQFTNPAQIIQKADPQPKRDPNDTVPMQIRSIARKSTGLQS